MPERPITAWLGTPEQGSVPAWHHAAGCGYLSYDPDALAYPVCDALCHAAAARQVGCPLCAESDIAVPAEHVHEYVLQSVWRYDPVTGMYWQIPTGYRCECGKPKPPPVDDAANLAAGLAYIRERYGQPRQGWKAWLRRRQ